MYLSHYELFYELHYVPSIRMLFSSAWRRRKIEGNLIDDGPQRVHRQQQLLPRIE